MSSKTKSKPKRVNPKVRAQRKMLSKTEARKRNRKILLRLKTKTTKEVAAEFNMSRQRVQQIRAEARKAYFRNSSTSAPKKKKAPKKAAQKPQAATNYLKPPKIKLIESVRFVCEVCDNPAHANTAKRKVCDPCRALYKGKWHFMKHAVRNHPQLLVALNRMFQVKA